MKQFQAKTLEEAYEKATSQLKCSITDLKIEIVQQENKGLFGLFAKDAIILAKPKHHNKINEDVYSSKPIKEKKQINKKVNNKQSTKATSSSNKKKILQDKEEIFDDFYSSKDVKEIHNKITIKKDNSAIIEEIKVNINKLFSCTCYKLDEIEVSFYDNETIQIEFQGDDAALLIGKEGYRYKALSYILFNWIHEKYNLMLRLEVAQFLNSQEEAIYNYLVPVIQTIKEDGFYKTKPLDGVLVHIALKKLREEFPDKYVAVKTNVKGDKYILVNEYRK